MPDEAAPRLWPGAVDRAPVSVPVTRLSSHSLRLADGQRIGALVGGRGIPLVVAHGFAFAGAVYIQSLARLASMGFKVIAVDLAGHGGSEGLPSRSFELGEYRDFLRRVLDELGVQQAVLCGHSLGGRLVAELAAADPDRAVAVLLIDAAVGSAWDELASFARWAPPMLGVLGATLAADTLSTLYLSGDQGLKLQALAAPQALANMVSPWKLFAPALSVLLAPGSAETLSRLGATGLPVFVLHGERDPVVPVAAARDAARRAGAELILVHDAAHSWVLEDPATLHAIVAELMGDGLGTACVAALTRAGLDSDVVSMTALEAAFYAPGAAVLNLGPGVSRVEIRPGRLPRFSWSRAS